ncbi:MAG: DoxX family protein [Alphaproteobacteria bacterium]|nr:DoxX family protein [Alphaproteobacteria bacterium]MBU1525722.1 DoxX family protein [Alphaproteobacteria bacterium]MBU2117599.1 DoxX family protein [Alphaproteobacteria bacterium]MBU2351897.1 DoxX family protein [Alphaproteobacteria bacterium]MBU2382751.1 DoxX family protein [Alphaproteobacteria bacterium]
MKAPPTVWTGRVLSGLFALFMLAASIAPKFFMPEIAREASRPIGVADENILLIGVIELGGTLLYIWPRTAFLGAIALTALLGGAIATHMNAGSPLFSHTRFGVYLGLVLWAGLWLRDPALRALLPFRARGE